MDLRDLRKKPLDKPPQDPTPLRCKIPVPIKSPKQKKSKRHATNILICSTPINAVKKNIFEADHQLMSPIRNPSSISSGNSSPRKIVDQEELENKLQVNKITKMSSKEDPEKLVTSNEKMQDCLFPFPLINKMQVYKMVLCDSEPDLPSKKLLSIKRGRKPIPKVKTYTTSDNDKNIKNTRERKLNETARNMRTVLTRSVTKTTSIEKDDINEVENIFEKEVSENEKNKKKNNRTNNNSNASSPTSKKRKIEDNEVTSKTENNSTVQLRSKIEKIEKDIQNGKTKCSNNLRSNKIKNESDKNDHDTILNKSTDFIDPPSSIKNSKTRKSKKDILNGKVADKQEANLQVLHVSNSTKCTVVLHNLNIEDNKISSNSKNKVIYSNNVAQHSDNLNEIKHSQPKSRGSPKAKNSKISENVSNSKSTVEVHSLNIEDGNKSSENKNKITNSNGIAENSHNLKEIQFSEAKRKGCTSKSKNSKIDENIHEIRRSSRIRVPTSKYWLNSQNPTDTNSMDKKSIETIEELKSVDLPVKDKKSKRISDKLEIENALKVDKKSSRTSDKLENNDLPVKIENRTRTLKSRKTNKQTKIKSSKETQFPKDKNLSKQSIKGNGNLSIRLLKPVLTAGKIRKSLVLEQKLSKFSTPKKIPKKQTKLKFSDRDESYTTEEENDIPKDTLMLNTGIDGIQEFPSSGKAEKRKIESNIEIYQPKKVKLDPKNDYNFKKMALLADVSPSKACGLADVQLDGKRCLLECFGKFPRHCSKNPQNSDISVGVSVNNGHITSGVLEIEPGGRKKYEYAKKVDLFFLILEGIAEVGIGNSSRVLRLGQDFYVPRDTPYYILNLSKTDQLMIHFIKIFK